MAYPESQQSALQTLLWDLIPGDGKSIGNGNLRRQLIEQAKSRFHVVLDLDDYWKLRDSLLRAGKIKKGQGKGGSVSRVIAEPIRATSGEAASNEIEEETAEEEGLYEPLLRTIRTFYAPDYEITDFVCEKTARQGRRRTGGTWTRPDITLVAVRNYDFAASKSLEVITFEVKPLDSFGIEGAFEAASHSRSAHRSCLLVQTSQETDYSVHAAFERLTSECRRFGITLITFFDPTDYDTFEVVNEAELATPAPADIDKFIREQLSDTGKDHIRRLLR
ncbi:MAG: hypothetical protein ABSF29_05940 [Tepidisphaeraceae bacterium]|jgi:hypothetical protein